MSFKCPHCGAVCNTRTSRMLSDQTQETRYRCSNDYCGHIFLSYEQIVRTLVPSAMPKPGVILPISKKLVVQEQLDGVLFTCDGKQQR